MSVGALILADHVAPTVVSRPARDLPQCITYDLCRSRSLVSVPVRVSDSTVSAMFPGLVSVQTYDSTAHYFTPTTMLAGVGDLVLPDTTALPYADTLCGVCLGSYTVVLHQGYNFIDPLCDTLTTDDLHDAVCLDLAEILRYDCASGEFIPTTRARQARAYSPARSPTLTCSPPRP